MFSSRTVMALISNLWKRRTKRKIIILICTSFLVNILGFIIMLRKHSVEISDQISDIGYATTEIPDTRYAHISDIPAAKVQDVDCRDIFQGMRGEKYEKLDNDAWHLPDDYFINNISNCETFMNTRKYIMKPVSAEEASFPLAFSLVVYKNVHQIEQLLRAIYRPQNYYCIHVDKSANETVYLALAMITGCFDNVFLSSKRLEVKWGEFSVLETELNCMQELWNRTDWKYFINLTGQEFPLKTILDMVRIFKVYNGSNAIDIHPGNRIQAMFQERVRYRYSMLDVTVEPKPPPPHNMSYTFGPLHVAVSRAFVDFVLHNKMALDFREWVKDTNVPDETFYPSLHINPQVGVPGAFTGDPTNLHQSYNPFIRYKMWHKCGPRGLRVRHVCILGVHNLYDLGLSYHMFANKFFPHHQPAARMCLEERLFTRTREQLTGGAPLNLRPYKEIIFVKHHNPS